MFIPIGDENPRERTPYVNYALLAVNVVVFFLFCFPTPEQHSRTLSYAMVPGRLDGVTLFTSMFLHANLMHIIGNMLFLWIFGDNVEDRLGHAGYLLFYLACGLAADFVHIGTDPYSLIPTLGASGAISGVVGAYVIFFPRHNVKMFLWFWFYWDVIRIPAFWWIGFWFFEQVLMGVYVLQEGLTGVAYWAHVGGFVAGAAVGLVARAFRSTARPSAHVPEEIRSPSRSPERRRPFITIEDDGGIEYMDEPDDCYAVLRLTDELHHIGTIAQITAQATGEKPAGIARRLEATRGMIARGVSRVEAERIQRALHANGLASALVVDNRANRPPAPSVASSASWDVEFLRLRLDDRIVPVPWSLPFLYVGARVGGEAFIDLFVNRRTAFRVPEGAALTAVDVRRRLERRSDLGHLARAVVEFRESAALNDGIRVLAGHGSWGWLAFKSPSEYDDYLFWLYNVILSQVPLHRV